jgi:endonuclease/exonuclease/phosphatase family metal-dependent hydrolase
MRIGSTVERLLVRTWNLFHGNTKPPGRKAFLEEMVRRATVDEPAVLCLQELPVWALGDLGGWSGMTALADVAQRPTFGPFPSSAELGRVLTDLHHGLLRSAFTGQANAVLVRRDLALVEHRHVALNPYRYRRAQARRLGLGHLARLAWGKERRVCQAVRLRHNAGSFVVGNVHATSYPVDRRLADAELLRAAVFVDGLARPDEPVLLCGDFNVTVRSSPTLRSLMTSKWGFVGAMPVGIDHVLVRGFDAGEPRAWPAQRRLHEGGLLSDHAPVEVEVR